VHKNTRNNDHKSTQNALQLTTVISPTTTHDVHIALQRLVRRMTVTLFCRIFPRWVILTRLHKASFVILFYTLKWFKFCIARDRDSAVLSYFFHVERSAYVFMKAAAVEGHAPSDWCTSPAILNTTRWRTGSQCSCRKTGVMWSHRRAPVTRRAAAFCTDSMRRQTALSRLRAIQNLNHFNAKKGRQNLFYVDVCRAPLGRVRITRRGKNTTKQRCLGRVLYRI